MSAAMKFSTPSIVRCCLGLACGFAITLPAAAAKIVNPVELPPVQEANCKELAVGDPLHEQCLRVRHILDLMSAEPRAEWAAAVESSLRHWMESLGPDGFTF